MNWAGFVDCVHATNDSTCEEMFAQTCQIQLAFHVEGWAAVAQEHVFEVGAPVGAGGLPAMCQSWAHETETFFSGFGILQTHEAGAGDFLFPLLVEDDWGDIVRGKFLQGLFENVWGKQEIGGEDDEAAAGGEEIGDFRYAGGGFAIGVHGAQGCERGGGGAAAAAGREVEIGAGGGVEGDEAEGIVGAVGAAGGGLCDMGDRAEIFAGLGGLHGAGDVGGDDDGDGGSIIGLPDHDLIEGIHNGAADVDLAGIGHLPEGAVGAEVAAGAAEA